MTCEDYPCCGHELGDCSDTETQLERDARYYTWALLQEKLEYEYSWEGEDDI